MSTEALWVSLGSEFGTARASELADTKIADLVRESLFPKQLNVLVDQAYLKAVLCPRRSGKSWTALSDVHDTCLRAPGSVCVIVCLTLKHCKNVYWNSVLPRFHRMFGIVTDKHHTDMRLTFPNGSIIYFVGAETKAEIEKLRGGSYDKVVIDECKSFPPDLLRELIYDVCLPACADRGGTVMMIGTPGSILEGPFYEGTYQHALSEQQVWVDGKATEKVPFSRTFDQPEVFWQTEKLGVDGLPVVPSYSRHSWTVLDNVYAPKVWQRALALKKDSGWADDHPTWLREWLGQWVSADDVYVYAYAVLRSDPNRRDSVQWKPARSKENPHGLPSGHEWRFILGMDLGFEDDFAMVVGAYSLTDGSLYQVFDYKINHQDVDQVAQHIHNVVQRFDNKIDAMVADSVGLGKMVVETLNRRHGYNIEPAEKREKYDFIELLNADFHSGRIKIEPESDLDGELRMLQWDLTKHTKKELVRAGRLKEHPGLPNHLCDALLYLWRYSYHTYSSPAVIAPKQGSDDWFQQWERESIEKMQLAALRLRSTNLLDRISERGRSPLEGHYERYR